MLIYLCIRFANIKVIAMNSKVLVIRFLVLAAVKGSYNHYIVNDELSVAYDRLKKILMTVSGVVYHIIHIL